uniref:Uncharacterized protein n=1 Tax=Mycena chlorophos TaxID=658473 RepID=A0ABQ0LWH4_MYCCL|nr:predicted protein [Mycena chlorophos]
MVQRGRSGKREGGSLDLPAMWGHRVAYKHAREEARRLSGKLKPLECGPGTSLTDNNRVVLVVELDADDAEVGADVRRARANACRLETDEGLEASEERNLV